MSNHMNNHHNDFTPWFGVLDNALGLTPVENPFENSNDDFDEDEYNADLTEMEQFFQMIFKITLSSSDTGLLIILK